MAARQNLKLWRERRSGFKEKSGGCSLKEGLVELEFGTERF